ncbi:MAG: class I SAM-dependent methyltransferase [Desulfobulbus sp.]|uniref:class I SAM-dependent methyltransferase n=1 Tax=Desulfobulbus sp. TaxID=895 RepID=UPI00284E7D69|nr:class I SAM-dependent methyltransferase [Desulfobulbus sp.]MDR2548588.1 class I SAM-dependent methyltransferase [Desulfobulbus sp.]
MEISIWGKDGGDYPFYDKLKFALVLRSLKKILPRHVNASNAVLLDVGCGYDARILQNMLPFVSRGIGLDFEVSGALKSNNRLSFLEGDLTATLKEIPEESVDVIVFLSILEHMDDPGSILRSARRLLRMNGRIFFCSPTWFGKWVLENVLSNRLFDPYGETPKQYNSHKMYYNPRDMWPLLVRAGFVSTEIRIWRSNFGCSISGYAEKTEVSS